MRAVWLFSIFLTIRLLFDASQSFALSADEIVKRADEGRLPGGEITFTAVVRDYDKGSLLRETKYKVYNRGGEAALIETIAPERQKGRKLLMEGDNLWFYTPDLKRPARVSLQQKLTGEISNGDLARTNFSGDYSATLVNEDSTAGKPTFHFILNAKHGGVTYSKIDFWITKQDCLPFKAIFYAASGKVLKTGIYSEPKTILNKKRITKITMQDALNQNRISILSYSSHRREQLPAAIFSKDGLDE